LRCKSAIFRHFWSLLITFCQKSLINRPELRITGIIDVTETGDSGIADTSLVTKGPGAKGVKSGKMCYF